MLRSFSQAKIKARGHNSAWVHSVLAPPQLAVNPTELETQRWEAPLPPPSSSPSSSTLPFTGPAAEEPLPALCLQDEMEKMLVERLSVEDASSTSEKDGMEAEKDETMGEPEHAFRTAMAWMRSLRRMRPWVSQSLHSGQPWHG